MVDATAGQGDEMSIIGINGSPRAGGNTASLIQEVLRGAESAGAETQLFQLGAMDISPCIDCAACRPTAKCAIPDDNQAFYEAAAKAQSPKGMVIGTPIYLDHISGQLKIWIDRLHAYNYTEMGKHMFPQGFKAVLVITYGAPKVDRYDSVVDWLDKLMGDLKYAEVLERIIFNKASRDPVEVPDELIARAREAGRRLANGA